MNCELTGSCAMLKMQKLHQCRLFLHGSGEMNERVVTCHAFPIIQPLLGEIYTVEPYNKDVRLSHM